jgi:hypothetical protein
VHNCCEHKADPMIATKQKLIDKIRHGAPMPAYAFGRESLGWSSRCRRFVKDAGWKVCEIWHKDLANDKGPEVGKGQ